ncbi:MAG: hypothetical protein ACFNVO_07550 [Prevotella sp.]
MKDNRQLSTQMYRKPEIELVRVQQERILLTGSDEDDGPIVIVTPENAATTETEAEGATFDISVIPPTQNAPETPGWH